MLTGGRTRLSRGFTGRSHDHNLGKCNDPRRDRSGLRPDLPGRRVSIVCGLPDRGPEDQPQDVSLGRPSHGITLSWDAVITECQRPYRLAWRSVRGFQNSGAYTLTRSPQGTAVSLRIEYHLPSQFLEALTLPLADRLTRALAAQILARVKRKLESEANQSGTAAPSPVTSP